MKKIYILTIAFLVLSFIAKAQEEKEKKIGIKFSGYVKNDVFFDSRQTVNAREGHFLLWPKGESLDANGDDINARSSLNLLAIQSRLKGAITGPDALGAKTSGVIEGAFFGHSNSDVNGFRLRHAFGKLDWGHTSLLFGQYWHPMFVTGCFPGVVSFNTGVPFQPFSRNPQLRVVHKFGGLSLTLAAISHRDFVTAAGWSGLSNSSMPDINFQVAYSSKNDEKGTEFLAGAGVEYKTIVPRLQSEIKVSDEVNVVVNDTVVNIPAVTQTYKVDESVSSFAGIAFAKIKIPAVTIKVEGVYGSNLYELLMISSYATVEVVDATTGEQDYAALNNYSIWTDIHTNGKKIQGGIFAGYTAPLGSSEFDAAPATDAFAGGRSNVAYVYRVAPRVMFNSGKMRFALEYEYTGAAFGDGTYDDNGIPQNETAVANHRVLLGAYYFF